MAHKKGWAAWNVGLWLANDEPLYREAMSAIRRSKTRDVAAARLLESLQSAGITHTPDGARYTLTSIRRGLVGL